MATAPTTSSPTEHEISPPARFDRALLEKYDHPGPRYTSYPTAPHFTEVGPEVYRDQLATRRRARSPLSLYFHVPFCRTRCFFCGCQVSISQSEARGANYLGSLLTELDRVLEAGAGGRSLAQIHWGGGTPTFLRPEELLTLGSRLRNCADWTSDYEFGVEVDPRRVTSEHLDVLAEIGVNRLSFGIQDVDPTVQRAIHRIQSEESISTVLQQCRRRGLDRINLDLIYGLPHQSVETFERTLDAVSRWHPDRIALFNFAYLPEQIPHQRAIDATALPNASTKLSIFELAIERLGQLGYDFIGLDHFARRDDPLAIARRHGTLTRNFQGYSTHGESDLLGLGNSAIGQLDGHYFQNLRGVVDYQRCIDGGDLATARGIALSPEDRLRRDVIQSLLCQLEVDKGEIETLHGISFDEHFAGARRRLEPLLEDGLLVETPRRIAVTPSGRFTLRNAAMAFDSYLGTGPRVRYSKVV